MMSPKDNDNDLNKKYNQISMTTLKTGGGQQETKRPLTFAFDDSVNNRRTCSNSNKITGNSLMVEPIKNNNKTSNIRINEAGDSNTSIKASNETCNLIGKMINNVSKTTTTITSDWGHNNNNNKQNDNITTKAIGNCRKSEGGINKIIIDDAAAAANNNNADAASAAVAKDFVVVLDNNDFYKTITVTTATTHTLTNTGTYTVTNCRDNDKQMQEHRHKQEQQQYTKMTSLNEVNREENILSTTTSCTLVNQAQALVGLINKKQQKQLESYNIEEVKGENLVTVKAATAPLQKDFSNKCANSRNKNITNQPLSDSYQRTLDLETLNASRESFQCELLELNLNVPNKTQTPKDYQIQQQPQQLQYHHKSLAERKALLKREFFKDFTTTANTCNIVKPIKSWQQQQQQQQQPLNKRILKKQHNLKLKIPRDCNYTDSIEQQPKVDLKLSLVALRKLDLQKRQAAPSPSQTNVNKPIKNSQFTKVKELAKKFDLKNDNNKMILPISNKTETTKSSKLEAMVERHSPLSDEGCNIGQSPYSSDDDNDSIRTTNTAIERIPPANRRKDKVARSASSDSALGLDVDEPMDITEQQQQSQHQQKRKMTLTVTDLPLRPALLPLAEPTLLPDSPSPLEVNPQSALNPLQQTQVPSKVLLEERVVEIPEDPRSGRSSRRESSQSCAGDWPTADMQGVRFVRTPSVVVSDYSDDITCGITLEEIEYFRAQRLRRRRSSLETSGTEKDALDNTSDISASSSCSNLYYCGSTISALDGAECLVNGVRFQLERKTSDCSTCSISGDEDTTNSFTIPEQPEDCQDITDMLAGQHLTSKRCKKVGISPMDQLTVDNANNKI